MILKQVFIINSDLNMGKGKIAVQVAHGEVFYMENALCHQKGNAENYSQWRHEDSELMKKVVLKSSQADIIHTRLTLLDKDIWSGLVYDRGLTQVAENSLTCIVVEPLPEEECFQLFGHLKLL